MNNYILALALLSGLVVFGRELYTKKCILGDISEKQLRSWIDETIDILSKKADYTVRATIKGYPKKKTAHKLFVKFLNTFKQNPRYFLCLIWGVESSFSENLRLINSTWDYCPFQLNICTIYRFKIKGFFKGYADIKYPYDLFNVENCIKATLMVMLYNIALAININISGVSGINLNGADFVIRLLPFYHTLKMRNEYWKYYKKLIEFIPECKNRCGKENKLRKH